MLQIQQVTFGTTNLKVSKLCFGALPMGPLQKGLSPQAGAEVIAYALKQGVNFIDTAELYGTYEHIRLAIQQVSSPPVIASKSAACSYEDMKNSVEDARRKLDLDVIPIFHLHAARAGIDVFTQRAGALKCLLEYKEKGIIGAVGIATHHCQVVTKAAENPDIDVVFALINKAGLGILGGSKEDMQQAMAYACAQKKGVYAMKAFAGGNLLNERESALEWVLSTPGLEVVAIGMVNKTEVDINLRMISQQPIPDSLLEYGIADKKLNVVPSLCKGCGTCTNTCPNGALFMQHDKAVLDRTKCILCGYCSAACPEFAIRMV
ncbi:MAG: aldo/keto reductase [Limnochordia bacterium]|nr:aldo/keto reductase [Limnochordia bacterium]MDD2628760.1 aldo/keto reductase [Limnochordia bacterium]